MPHRSDFGTPCCLRPTEAGSALGSTPFEATFTFTVITARQLVVSPRETLSIGFRILISLHPAIQTTGRLTFAPAGLPPAEHTSLNWTHFRTVGFPQSGFRAGLSDRTFLDVALLKPSTRPSQCCSKFDLSFVRSAADIASRFRAPAYSALHTHRHAHGRFCRVTPGVLALVRCCRFRSVIA
jgi:hypothetical protein